MHTMLNILLASIFVIAVDFAYTALSKRVVYRSMGDSLARLWQRGVRISQSLTSSKLGAQLKSLTGESCPNCLSTNIRRSHRYSFEKLVSIFGLWPYPRQPWNTAPIQPPTFGIFAPRVQSGPTRRST